MERSEFDQRLLAAQAEFSARNYNLANKAFRFLIDDALGAGCPELAVRARLEYAGRLTIAGQHSQAWIELRAAEDLAGTCDFPLDEGDFADVAARVLATRFGSQLDANEFSDDEVIEQFNRVLDEFLLAQRQYRAAERMTECADVATRYAFFIGFSGDYEATVAAHRAAIEAARRTVMDPARIDERCAVHLAEIARNAWGEGRSMVVIDALIEAREIHVRGGRAPEAARTDVELGDAYASLQLIKSAREHWNSALEFYLDDNGVGDPNVLSVINNRLRRFPEQGDRGPERP